MSSVISNTTDGRQTSAVVSVASGWGAAHDHVGFSTPTTNEASTTIFGPRAEFASFRGGIYFISRAFFDFDLSGVSIPAGQTITEAFFKIKTATNGGHDNIVVKSGHDPSTTSDSWFSTWLTGQGITLSGWSSSDVTAYSSNYTAASGGSFSTVTLNSTALTDLNSAAGTSTPFKIAVINYDFDYLDVDPQPSSGLQRTGCHFADDTNSGNRPNLALNFGAATTGYGNNVIGVSSSDIAKVNGVATGNIGKVIGVD